MGDSRIEHVLQDLNLKAYTKTFIDEKITSDIVCKLSSHEMEAVGVSSKASGTKSMASPSVSPKF